MYSRGGVALGGPAAVRTRQTVVERQQQRHNSTSFTGEMGITALAGVAAITIPALEVAERLKAERASVSGS